MKTARRTQNQASEFTLPREAIVRIITAASEISEKFPLRNRVLVSLLYWNALRREEAATLDMRDVDFHAGTLTIIGKGAKRRTVPVRPELLSDLRILVQGRRIDPEEIERGRRIRTPAPVFRSYQHKSERPYIHPTVVNRVVATAARHAGVSSPDPTKVNVNPHLLRHSFGRHFLDAGGDVRVLSYLLGHTSIATTIDIYGTPSQEYIAQAYERFLEQQPGQSLAGNC